MRVLIAGCGYVGTALGLELRAVGHHPFGLRRAALGLPEQITPIAADLTDPDTLSGLPADLGAVVITTSAGSRDEEAYRAAYLDGPRNLLAALDAPADTRLVFVSSTAVYGQQDGSWVDEDTATDPATSTGRILVEAEEQFHRLTEGGTATVVRFAGIYGPGRTRLVDQVRDGEAVCPPRPSYTNRIHRDDCAGFLHHLVTLAQPEPHYIGVDDEPADRCTVYRWIAEQLGLPEPPTGEDVPDRGVNKRCRNHRLSASRYRLRYPTFRDGYRELLSG